MTNIIRFESDELDILEINSMSYVRSGQIGRTLGLVDASNGVNRIYKRNKSEFSPDMTMMIEIDTAGGKQMTRFFSLRGVALIGLFSHTDKGARLRAWALDLMEGQVNTPQPVLALPAPQTVGNLRALSVPARSVLKYRRMGLSISETARLVRLGVTTVKDISASLRSFGLLGGGAHHAG